MDRLSLADLRYQLPVTKKVAYFQTGTYGPTLASVLKVIRESMQYEATNGPARPETKNVMADQEESARIYLAKLLSVEPDELGIGTNTTRSMQQVIRSIDWRSKDKFVTTSLEHVSTADASKALMEECSVNVEIVNGDHHDADLLEALDGALTDNTKLMLISHVASPNGRILPVREAASLAHQKDIPVLLDAAQSIGQFPIEVPSLGCDYVIGSGPKWLLGPTGSGYIWVTPDQVGDFKPNFTPEIGSWSKSDQTPPLPNIKTRTELGTYNHALVIGLGQAAKTILQVGTDVIRDHVAELSRTLREEMANTNGINVLTPTEPGKSAGVTTLSFDGYTEKDLQDLIGWLDIERNILVKFQWLTAPLQLELIGMRISVAGFNTPEEIHHLVDSIKEGIRVKEL